MNLKVSLIIGIKLGYKLGVIINTIKIKIGVIFKYNNNKYDCNVRYIIYNL